jgi:hypothetical protein
MPFPQPADVNGRFRADLQGLMVQFDLAMSRRGFIGNRIFPVVNVGSPGGMYRKVIVEELLKELAKTRRAPGAGYQRDSWKWTEDSYQTYEYGAEEPIDNRTANEYASLFSVERISSQRAVDRVLRAQELRDATLAFDETTFTNAARFTDVSATDPITDPATEIVTIVEDAKEDIAESFGFAPNVMATSVKNRRAIRNTDQFKDYIVSGGAGDSIVPGRITSQQFSDVFEIPSVVFADGGQNLSHEGQAASFGYLWSDKYILLAYVDPSDDILAPTFGRTFHWGGDGSLPECRIEDYPEQSIRGRVIRARNQVGEKVTEIKAGWLIKIRP